MRDSKGFLPAHCACTRHCSPEKIRLLLDVNPEALFAKSNEGESLMDLTRSTATKAHPNHGLIDELERIQSLRSLHPERKVPNDAAGGDPQNTLSSSARHFHNNPPAGTNSHGDAEQYSYPDCVPFEDNAEAFALSDAVLEIMGSATKYDFNNGDDLPHKLPHNQRDAEQQFCPAVLPSQENAGVLELTDAMLEITGSATKHLQLPPGTIHSPGDAQKRLSQERAPGQDDIMVSASEKDRFWDHKRLSGGRAVVSQKQGKLRKIGMHRIQSEVTPMVNMKTQSSEVEAGCELGTVAVFRV